MTSRAADQRLPDGVESRGRRRRSRLDTRGLLRLEAVLLTVLPANLVIGPLGWVGAPARLLALGLLVLWVLNVVAPGATVRPCPPVRIALGVFWAAILVSYVLLHFHPVPYAELRRSDNMLVAMAAFSGLVLSAAEMLRSREDVLAVVRTAVYGCAFSALVAILQFRPGINLASYIAKLPILQVNGVIGDVGARSGFSRPPGTALHPIEFGVVTALALAFAIHLFLYDAASPKWRRGLSLGLIALAIPIALSRSGLLAAAVVVAYFALGAPPRLRLTTGAVVVVFTIVIFVAVPGMIGNLKGLVFAGASDASIAGRTEDYAAVAGYIRPNVWFGRGIGTFLPQYRILDNQYLLMLIEGGVAGVLGTVGLFVASASLGKSVRARSTSEEDRNLGQMFRAVGMASLLVLFTFDAFSFPTYTSFAALWLGLAGALWVVSRQKTSTVQA